MGHTPFATQKNTPLSAACRRRSSRIDFVTPVVLSGRDATGQTYRDETTTEIVNIHGARIRTGRRILVGMLVTVECTKTGRGSKGVCVNVYEPTPESPLPAIAVQILHPGNIWGVENPPADWVSVLASLGTAPKASPADSSWSGVASKTSPAPRVRPTLAPGAAAAAGSTAAKLNEEAEQITRNALAAYEQRLAAQVSQAEEKLSQCAEQAATELATSVQALKGGVVAQIVEGAREELEARLEAMVRGHEERIAQTMGKAESDFKERLTSGSSQEVHASQVMLEEWMGGLMRKHETHFTELTEQAVAELAAAGQELKVSAALELADSAREALRPSLENIEAESQARLSLQSAKLEAEIHERLAAQAKGEADAQLMALEQRHAEAMRRIESELTTRVNETLRGFEGVLNTFRAHFADDLAAQNEKAIQEAEQLVRTRLAAMLSTLMAPPAYPVTPPAKK